MAKVIDFDDAVKALRKGAKEVGEAVSKNADNVTAKVVKEAGEAVSKNADEVVKTTRAAKNQSAKLLDSMTTPDKVVMREIRAEKIASKNNNLRANAYSKSKELKELYGTDSMDDIMKELRAERTRQTTLKNKETQKSSGFSAKKTRMAEMTDEQWARVEAGRAKEEAFRKQDIRKTKNQQGNPNPAGSAATGNASAKGVSFDKNNMAYRAAAAGVGGALIFSMANNKGQQSNQQLYGQ